MTVNVYQIKHEGHISFHVNTLVRNGIFCCCRYGHKVVTVVYNT